MDNTIFKVIDYLKQCELKYGVYSPVLTPKEMETLIAFLDDWLSEEEDSWDSWEAENDEPERALDSCI